MIFKYLISGEIIFPESVSRRRAFPLAYFPPANWEHFNSSFASLRESRSTISRWNKIKNLFTSQNWLLQVQLLTRQYKFTCYWEKHSLVQPLTPIGTMRDTRVMWCHIHMLFYGTQIFYSSWLSHGPNDCAQNSVHNGRRVREATSPATLSHPNLLETVTKGWNNDIKMGVHEMPKSWKLTFTTAWLYPTHTHIYIYIYWSMHFV